MLISCFMIMKLNYEMNDSSEKKETHNSPLRIPMMKLNHEMTDSSVQNETHDSQLTTHRLKILLLFVIFVKPKLQHRG